MCLINNKYVGLGLGLIFYWLAQTVVAADENFFMQGMGGPIEPRKVSYLEYSYAQMRAQQIRDLHYDLSINLNETSTDYSGTVAINFSIATNNISPVRIDFEGGEVKSLTLNGQIVEWTSQKWFLLIAAEKFKPGKNNLIIQFVHPYTTTGDGLHRYKDQETGNVYLYSNFEPFNAHKMFPNFDQPNLKAVFKLKVVAPRKWTLISTEQEASKKMRGKQTEWNFPATPPISSYVFSLHAGPYAIWNDHLGNMPLRLFARKELAKYIDYKEWFKVTKQAFVFYDNYFEYKYPFKKYDQLIVPDFNSGAMENVGAVTFNERYAPRSKKSWLERLRIASVISHEMAHMWFGDLVTMDWWNGLWLNESFATYMSALQQSENSDFKSESWNEFYLKMKQWGYQEDQKVTTHAIELPVANTEEAFTNFDGITYGKGAAVLRQLAHYVGEENFRKGVVNYLKKNAYANGALKDFIDEIGRASGKDLTGWSQAWLNSASLNSISADFECTEIDGRAKISRFDILQTTNSEYPTLRQHKLDLALITLKDGKIALTKTLPIEIDSDRNSIASAIGEECPNFVYPNLNDWGYVKVSLDKKSRQFLVQHINEFEPSLNMMLWQNLWDDVLDAKISIREFIQFISENLSSDKSDKQIGVNMERLMVATAYLQQMQVAGQDHREDLIAIENILFRRTEIAKAGSDMQRGMFNLYLAVVHSQEGLAKVYALLRGDEKLKGLVIDQDLRWPMLIALNHYAFKDYSALTDAEVLHDISDYGQQMAKLSEVVRPDTAIKEKGINEILSPNSQLKFATQKVILNGLFPADQTLMRKPFETKIIQALPSLVTRSSDRFMIAYTRSSFMPGECTEQSVKTVTQIRDTYADLSPSLKKVLRVSVQEEERCVAMKKLMDTQSAH